MLPLTVSWGDYDSCLPLLLLSKDFFSSPSLFTHARVAWAFLYHCYCCLFTSERGQPAHQHLKCPLEGDCGWMQEDRCWWLPQPFLWALSSCNCDCWLVQRVNTSTTDFPSLSQFLSWYSNSQWGYVVLQNRVAEEFQHCCAECNTKKRNTDSVKCTASQTWSTIVSAVAPSAFSLPCITYPCLCCSRSEFSSSPFINFLDAGKRLQPGTLMW